jgi:hypothetical protein
MAEAGGFQQILTFDGIFLAVGGEILPTNPFFHTIF